MRVYLQKKFLFSCLSLVLVGCSTAGPWQTNSQNDPDLKAPEVVNYIPASDVKKTKVVVDHYIPVAVPGQMMPVPTKSQLKPKAFLTKEKAVAYANKKATRTPKSSDFFNSMMRYNYMPDALYTVYTAPMHITDVVLEQGEVINSIAAGDVPDWQISSTFSGEGSSKQYHVLIKPNSSGLENTVLITTNKRTYHLILKSTNNNVYMVSVEFNYPHDMVQTFQTSNTPVSKALSNSGLPTLDPNTLNVDYRYRVLKGKKPTWFPTKVYSSGHQTFIKFNNKFYNSSTPVLMVANDQGKFGTMTANYRVKGQYMIVDGIYDHMRLQTGNKTNGKETIVEIESVGQHV
ncbi:hypothetical protein CF386_12395 [Paraphotobacterium marinum]|uniref:P-type conjugative transfer protein TrbG n=1 Tax=Paraphotobacterium marinum TaxID=1755811 RepID=A0A220VI20_9GAMM|nr:TrbG/VirB9 family P-type conjugative transfer protein [Paraphotobacterium marinum]ASK79832.1 hypothetical protein CF386_12395 [Paraphotobacterium marinum]